MVRRGIRFSPPAVALTDEVRWVLVRAFADPERTTGPVAAGDRALAAARRLALAPRIASRLGGERLAAEVGEAAAAGFAADRVVAAAAEMALAQAGRDLARTAAGLAIPVVFLKGAALHFAGVTAPGGRRAHDLDALVPAGRGDELRRALVGLGYGARSPRDHRHHLPPIEHPLSTPVEIHHLVPEVRVGGGEGFATCEEVLAAGLAEPAPGLGATAHLPTRELLAAHALAHGIAHHGWRPRSYPAMRMLADLVDLGLAGPEGAGLLAAARRWIEGSVSAEEAAAAREAAAALAAGGAADLLAGEGASEAGGSGGARLLRHVLAGAFDDDYSRSLKISALEETLPGRGRPAGALLLVRQALFLSREQIDAIYGPPASPLGYLGRRLWRPVDLAARTLRSAASWWTLHRRSGRGE